MLLGALAGFFVGLAASPRGLFAFGAFFQLVLCVFLSLPALAMRDYVSGACFLTATGLYLVSRIGRARPAASVAAAALVLGLLSPLVRGDLTAWSVLPLSASAILYAVLAFAPMPAPPRRGRPGVRSV